MKHQRAQSEIFDDYESRHPGDMRNVWGRSYDNAKQAGARKPADNADSAISKYLKAKGVPSTVYGFQKWRRHRTEYVQRESQEPTKPESLREIAMLLNIYSESRELTYVARAKLFSYIGMLYDYQPTQIAEHLGCKIAEVVSAARDTQGMQASEVVREVNALCGKYITLASV